MSQVTNGRPVKPAASALSHFMPRFIRRICAYLAGNHRRFVRVSILLSTVFLLVLWAAPVSADNGVIVPKFDFVGKAENPDDVVVMLEILFLLTVLTLAPSIVLMCTCFTRIIIVLSFLRRALSTQELPPNQVLMGLALFLTFMIMRTTIMDIKEKALVPYLDAEISQREAFRRAELEMREFMLTHTGRKSMVLFINLSRVELKDPQNIKTTDIPTSVLIPAFMVSELKRAFEMGFLLYLPFVIIDLVVSSTLISMGMLVLPPILISLPFKIMLFVLVDGWGLIITSLVKSFNPA